ncbi:DNA polymerase epsilon subunit C, partial [Eremomyces bilateralis CBS 781.70]
IEVKTKFPVARIKRIMQADEDVGKVSQVVPPAVAKALELFMIALVTHSATEAKSRSSKRVTAQHLKQAVLHDEKFDFLTDIVSKVPDAPPPTAKDDSEGDGKKKR